MALLTEHVRTGPRAVSGISERQRPSSSRRRRACTSACSIFAARSDAGSAASAPRRRRRRCSSRRAAAATLEVPETMTPAAPPAFARRFLDSSALRFTSPGRGARLCVHRRLPPHAGLGSGTQLALAVGRALAELHGIDVDAPGLAQAVGRARRSAIGTWTFAGGGLVVEGGRRPDARRRRAAARAAPVSSRVALRRGRADSAPGINGGAEDAAFAQLPPPPEARRRAGRASRADGAAAGARRCDLATFGAALTAIQTITGRWFAPVQGGTFAPGPSEELVRRMTEWGAAGVGQSSWGPTVYGIVEGDDCAARLADQVRTLLCHDRESRATSTRARFAPTARVCGTSPPANHNFLTNADCRPPCGRYPFRLVQHLLVARIRRRCLRARRSVHAAARRGAVAGRAETPRIRRGSRRTLSSHRNVARRRSCSSRRPRSSWTRRARGAPCRAAGGGRPISSGISRRAVGVLCRQARRVRARVLRRRRGRVHPPARRRPACRRRRVGAHRLVAISDASIRRVEASRGPGASMYGDSAIGGVIQILTDRGRDRRPADRHRPERSSPSRPTAPTAGGRAAPASTCLARRAGPEARSITRPAASSWAPARSTA